MRLNLLGMSFHQLLAVWSLVSYSVSKEAVYMYILYLPRNKWKHELGRMSAHPRCTKSTSQCPHSAMLEPEMKVKVLVAQLGPTLQPMIYSPPGSSVHGILQARSLEWVAIHFS